MAFEAAGSLAEKCRANGWGPGVVLYGDEGGVVGVIRLTGVGDAQVLARDVAHRKRGGEWRAGDGDESHWKLRGEYWRPATAGELAEVSAAIGRPV